MPRRKFELKREKVKEDEKNIQILVGKHKRKRTLGRRRRRW